MLSRAQPNVKSSDHAAQVRGEGARALAAQRTPSMLSIARLPAVPGLKAYRAPRCQREGEGTVPGFEPQPYRDFGHTLVAAAEGGCTGIASIPLPGKGAQHYRELGQTATGNRGTTSRGSTGILSTPSAANSALWLLNSSRNFVFINLSVTTTTGGGVFCDQEERGWPRKG